MAHGGSRGGHGWRRMFHTTGLPGWQRAQMGWPGPGAGARSAVPEEQERSALKQRAAILEQALVELRTRIDQLEKPVPNAGPLPEKDAR